jgi:hypothetical protein
MKLYLVLIVGWLANACSGTSSIHHPPERDSAIGEEASELACQTSKIQFTQQTGCANDGALEFCLSASDSIAMGKILEIDRSISCKVGSSGRAQCKRDSEQLCTYPIPHGQCGNWESPLPEEVWNTICQLAELDAVKSIVRTVLE